MVEINNLRSQLSERIYNPTVQTVFDEYDGYGCLGCYKQIIDRLPPEAAQAIVGVQATQVYKEKALWPIYFAEGVGLDRTEAVKVGATTDLLWGLSTIIDDISDQDQIRGDKPSLWVELGAEKAKDIAFLGLKAAVCYLHDEVNPRAASLVIYFARKGVISIALHKRMAIDVDTSLLLNNYSDRDDFHSAFPFYVLYDPFIIDLSELDNMILGVRLINQAGQIVNDTKDILPRLDGGVSRLSDFREGQTTIALKCLYSNLPDEQKLFFLENFGSGKVDYFVNRRIGAMVDEEDFRGQMRRRIEDTYARGFNLMSNYISKKGVEILEEWITYKIGALNNL